MLYTVVRFANLKAVKLTYFEDLANKAIAPHLQRRRGNRWVLENSDHRKPDGIIKNFLPITNVLF